MVVGKGNQGLGREAMKAECHDGADRELPWRPCESRRRRSSGFLCGACAGEKGMAALVVTLGVGGDVTVLPASGGTGGGREQPELCR